MADSIKLRKPWNRVVLAVMTADYFQSHSWSSKGLTRPKPISRLGLLVRLSKVWNLLAGMKCYLSLYTRFMALVCWVKIYTVKFGRFKPGMDYLNSRQVTDCLEPRSCASDIGHNSRLPTLRQGYISEA